MKCPIRCASSPATERCERDGPHGYRRVGTTSVTDFGAATRIQQQDRTTTPQLLTRWARCISIQITAECGPINGNGLRTCDERRGACGLCVTAASAAHCKGAMLGMCKARFMVT
jgi:hypothetical protein